MFAKHPINAGWLFSIAGFGFYRGVHGEVEMIVRRTHLPILLPLFVCFSLLAGASCASQQQDSTVIADSAADFSGAQGSDGWFYGYWDRSSDQDGVYSQANDFRLLAHFGEDPINGLSRHPEFTTGELWYLEDGHYYTSLWAEGGHPHGTMDLGVYAKADHWVVRRWISSVDSDVEIVGHAGKVMPWGENWAGDVNVLVVVGDSRVYEAAFSDGGEGYSVRSTVQAGTPVDFLIGPGSGIGVIRFTGTIKVISGELK
ncbi:hypothetical protein N9971_00605 [bacterium]|nr:hypothetical protein [bacterium]